MPTHNTSGHQVRREEAERKGRLGRVEQNSTLTLPSPHPAYFPPRSSSLTPPPLHEKKKHFHLQDRRHPSLPSPPSLLPPWDLSPFIAHSPHTRSSPSTPPIPQCTRSSCRLCWQCCSSPLIPFHRNSKADRQLGDFDTRTEETQREKERKRTQLE